MKIDLRKIKLDELIDLIEEKNHTNYILIKDNIKLVIVGHGNNIYSSSLWDGNKLISCNKLGIMKYLKENNLEIIL